MAFGCGLVGAALILACRDGATGDRNAAAGLLLGALLTAIGAGSLVASETQTIVIDPDLRQIIVEDTAPLRVKRRAIPFENVSRVGLGFLGKRSNFVPLYYLVLELRDGRSCPLFAPGRFFPGSSDRSEMAGRKARLERMLGLGAAPDEPPIGSGHDERDM